MGWISTLFGGKAAAEETVKLAADSIRGIGTWIDERNLTDEEKIKYTAQAAQMHLELVKATASENSVRSVTRRYLAWAIVGTCLLAFMLSVGLTLAGREVQSIIDLANAFGLSWAFSGVVIFYFGASISRSLRK
jgi:hypothetical protein